MNRIFSILGLMCLSLVMARFVYARDDGGGGDAPATSCYYQVVHACIAQPPSDAVCACKPHPVLPTCYWKLNGVWLDSPIYYFYAIQPMLTDVPCVPGSGDPTLPCSRLLDMQQVPCVELRSCSTLTDCTLPLPAVRRDS